MFTEALEAGYMDSYFCLFPCFHILFPMFREALEAGYMDTYFSLASQFRNQGERTFCGTSTLLMALNTLEIEPWGMWKDSQRWHHENMLTCCVSLDTIRKCGITLKELVCIAQCNALHVNLVSSNPSVAGWGRGERGW